MDRAFVREAFGSLLVAGGEEPVLASRAGLASPEAVRARDAAFGDQADGAVLQDLEVTLDAFTAWGIAGTAAASPSVAGRDRSSTLLLTVPEFSRSACTTSSS